MSLTRHTAVALLLGLSTLTTATFGETADEWRKTAVKKIVENQIYPRSAIAREIEGRAVVLLKVAADGTITSHDILQPTGEVLLDREIPKIIERSSPLPPPPQGATEVKLAIPLNWSLH